MKATIKLLLILTFVIPFASLFSQTDGKYFLDENIDYSVSPTQDFFLYANGNFIKKHPIPPSEHTYGIFNLVEDSVYEYVKNICLDAMNNTNAGQGSNTQKIGDFFFSGMDTVTIEKNGLGTLKDWMKKIENVGDKKNLVKLIGQMHSYGMDGLFGFFIGQDLMQSSRYKIYLYQGGIGLPERDYYFLEDKRTIEIRAKYKQHLKKIFELLGDNEQLAADNSFTVFKIETDLAKNSRKLEDLRDDYANYNKMSFTQLKNLTPSIGWKKYFVAAGINKADSIVVGQPEFFTGLEKILDNYTLDEWIAYLKWNLIQSYGTSVNRAIEDQMFEFYGKILTGTTEQRPRYKRILDKTNALLGEIVGMEYVRLYFPPECKTKTKAIVDDFFTAFGERVKKLDWMSEETKQKALKKLSTIVKKIGYPDKWKDYSTLNLSRKSYLDNEIAARRWHYNNQLLKLDKPVDRSEWDMNPQTYNAYYNPSNNEIVIPAAILTVPGKRMDEVDDAFLYGFIGASTIGHEMTHGFDDSGRLYDEEGNLKGWWTISDSAKFVKKSQLMVDQFSNYKVLDSMHVNGKATLGENIADLGGLVIGYDALKMTKDWQSKQVIGGFTADQRYFLGYAYSWAVYKRPERLAQTILTDVHSPAFLRVNGPMSNMKEFYDAFSVKDQDVMFRSDNVRVQIW